MHSKNKKIICAMSGGLDSSVAAALLKRAGFDVIGVFMKFWTEPERNCLNGCWNRCCSPEAEARARKVAKILDIPFYVFNFETEFKKRIVDCFLKSYKNGITPNPCVVCNKEIKFGLLLEKALDLGADFVATGHYAQLKNGRSEIPTIAGISDGREKTSLFRGKDKNKDQSYFLWMLNQKQLKRVLFPIGSYTKDEARKLAKKFKLPILDIPESMEICFIRTTINDFLNRYLKTNPGKIVDVSGKIIGEHQGLHFYTIGQRKGIKLFGSTSKPFYVADKDLKKNLLIVTQKEKDLYKKELIVRNVNWITGKEPSLPVRVQAKIRYRQQAASANLIYDKKFKVYRLKFNVSQRAITPGQSAVFYLPAGARGAKAGKNGEVLGGGIIC